MKLKALLLFVLLGGITLASALNSRSVNGAQTPPRSNTFEAREELYRLVNVGIAYLEQFKPEEAAKYFQQAVDKDANFALGHLNYAIAAYFNRDMPKAIEEARLALKQLPNSPHAHYILGLALKNERQYEEALKELNAVLAIDPKDPATNIQIGQIYAQQQQFEQAVPAYKRALENEPYNATAAYNLAQALQRSGKADESKQAFALFAKLRATNYKSEIGLNYGDVGRYAEAVAGTGAESDLVNKDAPNVKFVDATKEMNLNAQFANKPLSSALNRKIAKAEFESVKAELVSAFASSIGLCDYDGDDKFDVFVTGIGKDNKPFAQLFSNQTNGDGGKFSDVTAKSKITLSNPANGAVFGDFDNDGKQDIAVFGYQLLALYKNNGDGSFSDVTEKLSLPAHNNNAWAMTAAFVDSDHDGDLDLFVGNFADLNQFPANKTEAVFPDDFAGTPNKLWRNNGEKDGQWSFTDISEQTGLSGGANKTTAVVCTDYDNHRDVDFFVVNYGAPVQLFANQRDGSFKEVANAVGLRSTSKAFGSGAGDINKDGFTDFFLTSSDSGIWMLSDGKGSFVEFPLLIPPGSASHYSAQVMDFDNDGLLEVLIRDNVWCQAVKKWGDNQDGGQANATIVFSLYDSRLLVSGDLNNDGAVDILSIKHDNSLIALRNESTSKNYLALSLKAGTSNKNGIGTKAVLRSGSLQQKLELYAASPAPAAAGLNFGLGFRTKIDALQLLWPAGIVQSELDVKPSQLNKFEELDRKGTSCPILYAWNGSEYAFVTDFLGGSAIGMREPGNTWSVPDTDEYVRVTGEQLRERDGKLSIRMNNQLEEVIFFDAVKLLAVDHPADTEIYPNEKLLPGPPYTPFAIHSVQAPRPPASAVDDKGNNILPLLEKIDQQYPTNFERLKFKGYAREHAMELDLGKDVLNAKRPLLLLSAWIDYADSTSNLAASQAGVTITPPYLQVKNTHGEWQTVIEQMGFPAGLTKTMTVDLTGKFLCKDARVRIVTSMRIYWDQILVDTTDGKAPTRVTTLAPMSADLHWRGFPRELSLDKFGLKAYDYRTIDPFAPWKAHTGNYTRYGDVQALLLAPEDMYVITRNGDEMQVDFDATKLPPLPRGWKRDYLVYADGFGKDMDLNSARPETVGELPFHKMKSYPHAPGEQYPTDEKHLEYLRKYNTRSVGVQTQAMWRGVK
ncbi:MAG: VCBS repeat-containing protein [Acidobacteria bacterium]|nr:VCBS repeat-containing protein [Acidobacteriota bacterium]